MNPFDIQNSDEGGITEEILLAIFGKGKSLFLDGDFDEALLEFEEALRLAYSYSHD